MSLKNPNDTIGNRTRESYSSIVVVVVVVVMNLVKLLFAVVAVGEVLFSKRSVGVWCALCARVCAQYFRTHQCLSALLTGVYVVSTCTLCSSY